MSGNNSSIARPGYPRSFGLPAAFNTLAKVFLKALDWSELARQRRRLMELDDHLLKDIGVSRADVEFEISKSFWSLKD